MTRGFKLAIKTFKGPCFGCGCGIKCCQLLLKWLGPKSEKVECLFNDSYHSGNR